MSSDKDMELLQNTYISALKHAVDNNWSSIAFPLLCSGASGLDSFASWSVALNTCIEFLNNHKHVCEKQNKHPLDITFCVVDEHQYQLGEAVRKQILGYKIDSQELKILELSRSNNRY